MQRDISWSEIKNFYTSKKERWALTKSYYSPNDIWAECSSDDGHPNRKYGYKLLDPYTEEEVILFEKKMGIELPSDLRYYLINVSRELFAGGYPLVFPLQGGTQIGTFQLPIGTELWNYGGCIIHGKWDGKMESCTEECSEDRNEPCGGTMSISDQSVIVVKGNEKGSVWDEDAGGDTLYRNRSKTFYGFITEDIRFDKRAKQFNHY